MSKHKFKTEVSQLLNLIVHSLYSHKEIFLRELVSNASDAMDRLKLLILTDKAYKKIDHEQRIDISFTEGDEPTLTIADTGIGMDEEELKNNLGTIAKSGTKSFVESLTGDVKKDSNMIGQFGVGFYSAFMVASKVEVISRKAGTDKAWRWISDGQGSFEISEAERDTSGTSVMLFLNDEGKEYTSKWSIESIIKKYSNHIPFPIFIHYEDKKFEGEGDDKKEIIEQKVDQVNAASALWKRPKKELKSKDYKEFYKSLSHGMDEPLHWIHTQAEGQLDYTTLFFIPEKAPFDLFRVDYQAGVKLYVKRVFITDDEKELMPTYLRFIKGIIDTEDLPLNVSREILQQNRVMTKIKSSSVKKILDELAKLQKKNREKYIKFYNEFGVPVKEGLYQDFENREKLMDLVMYKSTKVDGYTTLADYIERKQADQESIYFITGKLEDNLRHSPLLEMYKSKDIEVLIMDDEIDEIVSSTMTKYKTWDMKSVNRSDAAEDLKTEADKDKEKEIEPVIKKIKKVLGELVKDVKASTRLSDSPSCIVADSNDPTMQMQQIMQQLGQGGAGPIKPILEINPTHDIVTKLIETKDKKIIEDVSFLLLEQAMLIEGAELKNPVEFVQRVNRIINKAM